MGQIINGYQYAEAAGERIVGLLDMDPRIEDDPGGDFDSIEGHVEFDGVSFAYKDEDGNPDEQVLEDVSFEAGPGDYVGLVGPTGAGKSTTMKLLLRFYDPDEGEIRVDGTDVRDVSLAELRRSVGYVSQEPYLFYGTVTENVAYGLPDPDPDDVEAACRRAGAHEFVVELKDGYDTMVGERGVKLSGGQRQRIALARAILRDPDVLVLDEATSHVDNETEAVIQNSLEDLIADRTTFAIAHRLSTVRDADTILVMDDGEVVERGTHEELLTADGLYANLWRVQVGEVDALPEEFLERAARGHLPTSDDD
jgi:ATP-binding cassette subfamily B protein